MKCQAKLCLLFEQSLRLSVRLRFFRPFCLHVYVGIRLDGQSEATPSQRPVPMMAPAKRKECFSVSCFVLFAYYINKQIKQNK